jgi:prophage DNA circulation protein
MPDSPTSPSAELSDGLTASESSLGKALALIHRVLPLLQQPERDADVQKALRNAAALIEAARQAHAGQPATSAAPALTETVESEIVAVVAAAIAVLLERPHRIVSVVPVDIPVPHLNVWAFEGRSQLFVSHKVR